MNFSDYIKGLKKITLEDIKNIINQDLVGDLNPLFYGFRMQRGFLKFGQLEDGFIPNPYLFVIENEETLCQDLYNLLQKSFYDNCEFSYIHSFSGEYDYMATINNKVAIIFPNYNSVCQNWIIKKVELDKQSKKIR